MSVTKCTYCLLILFTVFFCGCVFPRQRPWQPGQYTMKEIYREYSQGTYKATFGPLPYEEKMNICLGAFVRSRPPTTRIVEIFEGSSREIADRVMHEIIEDAKRNDSYLVYMKVEIWDAITGKKREEYQEERLKILKVLEPHRNDGWHWEYSIAILGGL